MNEGLPLPLFTSKLKLTISLPPSSLGATAKYIQKKILKKLSKGGIISTKGIQELKQFIIYSREQNDLGPI